MKTMTIFLLAFSSAALGQQINFRGVAMGASEKELLKVAPFFRCESNPPRARTLGDRTCYAFLREKNTVESRTFAGINSDFSAHFYGDKLASIGVSFDKFQFSTAVAAMTEKFGAPSRRETNDLKTAMGLRFTGEKITWNRAEASLEIKQYGEDINTTNITYRYAPLAGEYAKRSAAAAKAAAKTL